MAGTYAKYTGAGGGGGGGIATINGNSSSAQTIVGTNGITVSSAGGTTTVQNSGTYSGTQGATTFTGQVLLENGSAALPSLGFTAQSGTGLYWDATTSQMAFVNSDAISMEMDAAGLVTISNGLMLTGSVPILYWGEASAFTEFNVGSGQLSTNLPGGQQALNGASFYVSGGYIRTDSDLYVLGHILAIGTTPSVAPQTAAGSGATASMIMGSDIAGQFSVTLGTGATAGVAATVTFAAGYSATPTVSLTPANASAAVAVGWYVTNNSSGLSLNFTAGGLSGTTLVYNYQVIQAT
jgi:hypothetical protein